jgi:hypothetical protein
MMYAHIFRAKAGVSLVLSKAPGITRDQVIEERSFPTFRDAKKYAASQGAKPWNY